MIITTTPNLETGKIKSYNGLVYGERYMSFFTYKKNKSIQSHVHVNSTKSEAKHEDQLREAMNDVMTELELAAEKLNSNAIVGLQVQYSRNDSGTLITAVGTAVTFIEDTFV